MAVARWASPSTRSSNIAGSTLNSLTNTSESAVVTYDNSSNRSLYGAVTVKLGSIATSFGASISLRITMSDGTDTADKIAGDVYTAQLTNGTSAKIVIFPMVRLYPFSLRFSIINLANVTFAASGNEMYVTAYNEDVT
jgi:hypothetical protein